MKNAITMFWFFGTVAAICVGLSVIVYILDLCELWAQLTGPKCDSFMHALSWTTMMAFCAFGVTLGLGVLTGIIGDR